jgi:predicted P-loop ATPase
MENKTNKQKVEYKSPFERMSTFLHADYEYRLNVISNLIQRRRISGSEWENINMPDIHIELYECGIRGFKEMLNQYFGSNRVPRYDPLKEYFETLPVWNHSEGDMINKLSDFVQTDDQIWWKRMFKKYLVRVVGQATGAIPFNKQCLTLVGKQNDGKTTFLDFLVPDDLKGYMKKGFDFGKSKEGKFSLVQNFLINLDELASFEKKDLNTEFKAILSESIVKFRLLFQNQETPLPRRASFVASTNRYEFLTDETGNVRWLPFVVKQINHDAGGPNGYATNVDMNRVWAQAFALLNEPTFNPNMTADEINQQEILNRRFLTTTAEMELISKFFDGGERGEPGVEFMTATEINEYLQGKSTLRVNRTQIGKALQVLGMKQESNYNAQKGYSEKGYYIKIK